MRTNYPRCEECQRPTRPYRSYVWEHPGTIARGSATSCMSCLNRRKLGHTGPARPRRDWDGFAEDVARLLTTGIRPEHIADRLGYSKPAYLVTMLYRKGHAELARRVAREAAA